MHSTPQRPFIHPDAYNIHPDAYNIHPAAYNIHPMPIPSTPMPITSSRLTCSAARSDCSVPSSPESKSASFMAAASCSPSACARNISNISNKRASLSVTRRARHGHTTSLTRYICGRVEFSSDKMANAHRRITT
eukprot:1196051-Prorocentrum_minimum.AAC.5